MVYEIQKLRNKEAAGQRSLNLSSLYVCMAIKHIIVLFVETPRKFITVNKFTWCFNKQNYYKFKFSLIIFALTQYEID